ncbi:MAG: ornithine carbamoyltransferase [Bacteroidetes bacterium]|nr:MAG: ornithine carbamoyltransferase [Bacteroidota bacterium]
MKKESFAKKDFISIADWSPEDLWNLLLLSFRMKEYPANYSDALKGKSVAMIFEKQSLRTHVTFDVGIYQLGGHSIYLSQQGINLGKRESIHDVAKNLERWVDGLVIRTYAHSNCTDLAKYMWCPVINALDELEHPCQAVGDFLTIIENFGDVQGKKLAFIGDGNNVCHSLMLLAAKLGMNFTAAIPKGYEPVSDVVKLARKFAKQSGAKIEILNNAKEGARNADVIYTDVWASMGQEAEKEERARIFKEFQINAKLMKQAKETAIFMHCLPAHRGEEVTDEVMDGKQSRIFDEAENRLHTQKAILHTLMAGM